MSNLYIGYIETPIGHIEVTSSETSIVKCNFKKEKLSSSKTIPIIMIEAINQLENYFMGKQQKFDLKLELKGTEFQQKVWRELQNISFGETIIYKELARRVGNEKAIRAVGNANGRNPISIIIPCHRVIGSNGDLRGYGGGIEKKKWLIDFESHFED